MQEKSGGLWSFMARGLFGVVVFIMDLAVSLGRGRTLRRLRRASVGRIASASPYEEARPGVAETSRSVAERAAEMVRTLRGSPSEIELEMCALGYQRCTEDVLRLARMVEEQRARCGVLRRLLLELYMIRASAALCRVHEAFPESAERINH